MKVLKEFDGEILNDSTVKAVEIKLFQLGLYRHLHIPTLLKQNGNLHKGENFLKKL